MKPPFLRVAALLFTFVVAWCGPANGAPGTLDPTFNSSGKLVVDFDPGFFDGARSVAVQDDGKILVAGIAESGFAVLRLNRNGELDTSFAGTGKLTISFGGRDGARDIVVLPDGKILVGGTSVGRVNPAADFAFARLNRDGSLDPTFGDGGKVKVDISGSEDYLYDIALQPDGKIVAVGWGSLNATQTGAVARFNTDGTLDTTFNGTGKLVTRLGLFGSFVETVAVQGDGKILIGGRSYEYRSQTPHAAIMRLNTDGSLDTSFNHVGYVLTPGGEIYNWAVQPDGRIVATGLKTIWRYNADGTFDTTFNGTGRLDANIPFYIRDVAVQSNGKIVIVGFPVNGSGFTVARFDKDGSSDTGFNGTGSVITPELPYAYGVALQRNGRIIVVGEGAGVGSDYKFAVARYYGGDAVPQPPLSQPLHVSNSPVPGAGVDPRIPSGAVWRDFGVPAISSAHATGVAFVGRWMSPSGRGAGIFVGDSLRVKAGDPVPGIGGAIFRSFMDPVLSYSGQVAFLATIGGPAVSRDNDTVVVGEVPESPGAPVSLRTLAREGEPAPGTRGALYRNFRSVSIQNGEVVWLATLAHGTGDPSVASVTDLGLWSSLPVPSLRIREGDSVAPNKTLQRFDALQAVRGSPGQGRSHTGPNWITTTARFIDGSTALLTSHFDGTNAPLTIQLETGDAVSFPVGAALGRFGPAASLTVASARTALLAQLAPGAGGVTRNDARGILVGRTDTLSPVAQISQPAPGFLPGVVFRDFKDPLYGGSAFFLARISGAGKTRANDSVLYVEAEESVQLLAQEGEQPPETSSGTQWKSFDSIAFPSLGDGPMILAFLARGFGDVDTTNHWSLWNTDSSGSLRPLFREGDIIGNKTVRSFSCLRAARGSPGVTRAFDVTGKKIVWRAVFTDGSKAIMQTVAP